MIGGINKLAKKLSNLFVFFSFSIQILLAIGHLVLILTRKHKHPKYKKYSNIISVASLCFLLFLICINFKMPDLVFIFTLCAIQICIIVNVNMNKKTSEKLITFISLIISLSASFIFGLLKSGVLKSGVLSQSGKKSILRTYWASDKRIHDEFKKVEKELKDNVDDDIDNNMIFDTLIGQLRYFALYESNKCAVEDTNINAESMEDKDIERMTIYSTPSEDGERQMIEFNLEFKSTKYYHSIWFDTYLLTNLGKLINDTVNVNLIEDFHAYVNDYVEENNPINIEYKEKDNRLPTIVYPINIEYKENNESVLAQFDLVKNALIEHKKTNELNKSHIYCTLIRRLQDFCMESCGIPKKNTIIDRLKIRSFKGKDNQQIEFEMDYQSKTYTRTINFHIDSMIDLGKIVQPELNEETEKDVRNEKSFTGMFHSHISNRNDNDESNLIK